jgi:hypothetical protein
LDIVEHAKKLGWNKVDIRFPENEDVFKPMFDVEPDKLFSININSNAMEFVEVSEQQLIYKGYQLLMAPYGEGIELLRNRDIEVIIEFRPNKLAP